MKKSITALERLQLLGLLTLARQHNKIVDQTRDAITLIIEEDDSLVHDAIWGYDVDLDKCLDNMGIKIKEKQDPQKDNEKRL